MLTLVAGVLALSILTHIVTCVTDDDHIFVAERAGKNAIQAIVVKVPDAKPGDGLGTHLFPNHGFGLASDAPRVAFDPAKGHVRAPFVPHRNTAIAHRGTMVLLI